MVWLISKLFGKKEMKKRKTMTASDFLNELAQDEKYQEQREFEEKRRLKLVRKLNDEAKPLTDELNSLGLNVQSVWDLVNSSRSYNKAIPVLKKHLEKDYSSEILEGIIRALTIPDAEGMVNTQLLEKFKNTKDKQLQWVIGNALAIVSTKDDINEVLELLSNKSYGHARSMLVHALARLQKNNSILTLTKYLSDEDILAQAVIALGDLRAVRAKEQIKNIQHSDSWIMEQVNEALRKITEKERNVPL